MDAGSFIYFPRDPGHNSYFKVFDGQDTARAPHPQSTVRPLTKKRDQFQPFPNSTDCHTKHIAMIHGLWPSMLKVNRQWTGGPSRRSHNCQFFCIIEAHISSAPFITFMRSSSYWYENVGGKYDLHQSVKGKWIKLSLSVSLLLKQPCIKKQCVYRP